MTDLDIITFDPKLGPPPAKGPMTHMTHQEFVELCRELRALGVTEVTAGGFTARFGPAPRGVTPKPTPPFEMSDQDAELWRQRAIRGA